MVGEVTLDIKGIAEVKGVLDRAETLVNPGRLLDQIGAVLLNRIRTRFLDAVDTDGNPWIESQAALQRQATGRAAAGKGTLFDTGTLFHSIQLSSNGDFEREIGTDVPYAAEHQFGLEGQERREFLGFSDDDINVSVRLVERALANL